MQRQQDVLFACIIKFILTFKDNKGMIDGAIHLNKKREVKNLRLIEKKRQNAKVRKKREKERLLGIGTLGKILIIIIESLKKGKKMNNSVSTMTGKTKLKVVLLGNQAVGKSSIIEKYVKDIFDDSNNPTVGIDFLVKNVTHKGKNYRLQLWDTAGQERFRSLIPNYLKDAKCAMIIIDVTSKTSLNNADSWLSLYNDNKTVEGFAFLVGNKIDLEYREVTPEEAQQKAKQLGLPYFEVSAKTGENIQQFFNKLIDVSQQQSLSAANFDLDPRKGQKENKETQAIKEEQENKQEDEQQRKNVARHEDTTIVLKNEKLEDKKNGGKSSNGGGCC